MENQLVSAIKISHVSKVFGRTKAVWDVSLDIFSGDIYALIGPNGGGKTTLIKMLVGLYLPTTGHITLHGNDIGRQTISAKRSFGYVPDNPEGYDYLSGYEFLNFTARLRGMTAQGGKLRIDELVSLFPLKNIISEPMESYSRGNRQKIAFLAALLTTPPALIIDEPIVGLDPPSIDTFGKIITDYAKSGGTVFFATHTLWFAKKYAKRVGVMKAGQLVAEKNISLLLNLEKLL